jgi:hypothetical protein
MNGMRKWIVSGFLLGAMACVGAPNAQAQYPNYPQDRRDDNRRDRDRDRDDYRRGSRGNYRDYQQDIRFLEDRIQRDKNEAYVLARRFGKNSYQARAARDRVKSEERQLKDLKKEWKRAQKNNRRYYRY